MALTTLPPGTKCNKCGTDKPPIYVRAKVFWCVPCWVAQNKAEKA